MSSLEMAAALRQALAALGVLFVIVNLRVGWQLVRWWRRRRDVVLAWPMPKPPFYAINLGIGMILGILLFVTASLVPRPAPATFSLALFVSYLARLASDSAFFGVTMMFLYYGYLLPLSTRIQRGLYRDGIWTDSGFMPYVDIGGLTWKGTDTLILASRQKALARRLTVPGSQLGEVRQLLREKIGSHAIEFDQGPGLHLGTRDTRESA